MEEIEENGYNLNIPRYVDTFEPEPEIDLDEVADQIIALRKEMKEVDSQLNPFSLIVVFATARSQANTIFTIKQFGSIQKTLLFPSSSPNTGSL